VGARQRDWLIIDGGGNGRKLAGGGTRRVKPKAGGQGLAGTEAGASTVRGSARSTRTEIGRTERLKGKSTGERLRSNRLDGHV